MHVLHVCVSKIILFIYPADEQLLLLICYCAGAEWASLIPGIIYVAPAIRHVHISHDSSP